MGSDISSSEEVQAYGLTHFNPNQWNKVRSILKKSPSVSILHSRQYYQSNDIYQSIHQTLLVEEYSLQYLNKRELQHFMRHLYWRKQCPQFVPVLFISENQDSNLCGESQTIKVYVEHMPLRLTKLNDIPFPENLYILRETLKGFSKVFAFFHQLNIHQDLICINKECQVKIWINSNLASPVPNPTDSSTLKTQAKIVASIIQLIADNTDHTLEPVDIQQFLRSKHKKYSFQGVLESIEELANILKAQIPHAVESAKILFQSWRQGCGFNSNGEQKQFSSGEDMYRNVKAKPEDLIPLLEIRSNDDDQQVSFISKDSNNCSTEMMTPHRIISSRSVLEPNYTNIFISYTSREHAVHQINAENQYWLQNFDSLNKSQETFMNNLQDNTMTANDESLPAILIEAVHEQQKRSQICKAQQWFYFEGDQINYIDPRIAADLALITQYDD